MVSRQCIKPLTILTHRDYQGLKYYVPLLDVFPLILSGLSFSGNGKRKLPSVCKLRSRPSRNNSPQDSGDESLHLISCIYRIRTHCYRCPPLISFFLSSRNSDFLMYNKCLSKNAVSSNLKRVSKDEIVSFCLVVRT